MNALDVVVLVAVAAGAFVGFRVGFVVRALSWLGLSIGLAVGLRLTPRLARSLTGSTPGIRLLAVASLLTFLAVLTLIGWPQQRGSIAADVPSLTGSGRPFQRV